MSSSPNYGEIAVATSIPPRLVREDAGHSLDDEYQKLCIQSWIDCGFRVLSVNDRGEIPDVAARYPAVNFVATDRNASAWSGRKTPYIADLLLALKDVPEPVLGIINSDLIFEPSSAWRMGLPPLVGEAIVVGQRYDTTSLLHGTFRRLYAGLDGFFFDKSFANKAIEHAMPFAMGLPAWDYWMPCVAAFNNYRILVADRPSFVHLDHKLAWSYATRSEFARIFANFVIKQFEGASHALPECISTIVPLCREIAAIPLGKTPDILVTRLIKLFSSRIRENIIHLEPATLPSFDLCSSGSIAAFEPCGLDDAVTTDNIFRRFDQRFSAGEALRRAKFLSRESKWDEAEQELHAAMVETPMDSDVLLVSGEFSFHRGEFQKAHLMLGKAAEQGSNSTRLLQLLGTVLHAMNRREAAIECFQNLLRLNPKFQPAYTDIAIVLWETNRQREALAHLARALDQWPDFARAAELYDGLRKEFRGKRAIPRPRKAGYKLATHYTPRLSQILSGTISRAINKVKRA